MMVELGKAQVFEGKILQSFNRVADCRAALADFVQQSLDKSTIHQRFSSVAA